MLLRKKGFFVNDLFSYRLIDRYSKKIGKISDLIIHTRSFRVDYIIAGGKKDPYIIPTQLITSEDNSKKIFRVSTMKERLIQNEKLFEGDIYILYSELKKVKVIDIMGNKLGRVKNIAYHTGLKAHLITSETESTRIVNFLDPELLAVPYECICFFTKDTMTIQTPKEFIPGINLSGIEEIFLKEEKIEINKKRYIIVEANVLDINIVLNQRINTILEAKKVNNIEVIQLNVEIDKKVKEFVVIFNQILMESPDTYIPITEDITAKYFNHDTFISYQHGRAVGYVNITIQVPEEDSENENEKIAIISGIGVHPKKRGQKLGLILFHYAIKYIESLEIKKVQADIYDLNIPSLNLFSSFRFQEVGDLWLD